MTSRDKLELLFKSAVPPKEIEVVETVKQVSVITKKEPPLRPCGCKSWFNNEICPYCGKRILKGVLPKQLT